MPYTCKHLYNNSNFNRNIHYNYIINEASLLIPTYTRIHTTTGYHS